METNYLVELAEKVDDLQRQLEEAILEMNDELENIQRSLPKETCRRSLKMQGRVPEVKDETPQDETPQDETPQDKDPQDETPQDETPQDETPKKPSKRRNGQSLKEVVQEILANGGPMEMKDIVTEVVRRIKNREYYSRAQKVTPIVTQALFNLRQEKVVMVDKSSGNKNLYSLVS